MAAWDIRKFVLACDHFDQPDVPAILAGNQRVYLGFDKPRRCNARFDLGFDVGAKRAAVRRAAAKKGWTHVHEPGTTYGNDKDYCPKHKPERS